MQADGLRTEKTDAEPRGVLRAAAYVLLATIAVAVGLVYVTKGLVAVEVKDDPPAPPLAEPAGRVPPEPRLQTLPFADVEAQHREEERVLTSYGWVDEKAGTVRIPIEAAMQILAKRGMPVASGPPPQASPAPAGAVKR